MNRKQKSAYTNICVANSACNVTEDDLTAPFSAPEEYLPRTGSRKGRRDSQKGLGSLKCHPIRKRTKR